MITESNKMYITSDIHEALSDLGNKLIEDILRKAIELEKGIDDQGDVYYTIRDEFQRLSLNDGRFDRYEYKELTNLVTTYLKDLKYSSKLALFFREIREESCYKHLIEDAYMEETDTDAQFDYKMGREIERFIYDQDSENWRAEYLINAISRFSIEFTLSEIVEETVEEIEHVLELYSKHQ